MRVQDLYGLMDVEEDLQPILQQASDCVSSVRRNLQMQIRQREHIDARLSQSIRQLEDQRQAVGRVVSAGRQAAELYERNEEHLLQVRSIESEISKKTTFSDWVQKNYEELFGKEGEKQTPWDLIKAYLTACDKSELPFAGFGKSALSYIESLLAFYLGEKKGFGGFEDICDLTESSSSLWTALYSLFGKFDATKTDNYMGIWAERWGRTAGKVSIFSSGVALLNAVVSAFNFDGKTSGQIASDFVNTGGEAAELCESIYDLRHFDTAALSKGFYTPAKLYSTLADTVCSVVGQGIESVEAYGADGSFDLMDLASTGIDVSVEGLYTMTSDLSFGIISEDVIGVSAEDISNSIKNYGKETGELVGFAILNNPKLYNAYTKGNTGTKLAIQLMLIPYARSMSKYITVG